MCDVSYQQLRINVWLTSLWSPVWAGSFMIKVAIYLVCLVFFFVLSFFFRIFSFDVLFAPKQKAFLIRSVISPSIDVIFRNAYLLLYTLSFFCHYTCLINLSFILRSHLSFWTFIHRFWWKYMKFYLRSKHYIFGKWIMSGSEKFVMTAGARLLSRTALIRRFFFLCRLMFKLILC